MNIRNFFFSQQTQETATSEPVIVREDFTIPNYEQKNRP